MTGKKECSGELMGQEGSTYSIGAVLVKEISVTQYVHSKSYMHREVNDRLQPVFLKKFTFSSEF